MASNRNPTTLSAAIAAWIGFPIGALFATVTLLWWVAWLIFGALLFGGLYAHIRQHRRGRP